jgi:DNA-directed RNA polymerase I subunit RPA1
MTHHHRYEFYGPRYAGSLLTVLGRLFSSFLQWHGFTQGIDDLLVTDKANAHRRSILSGAHAAAAEASATFAEMDASTLNPHSAHDQDVVAHNLHVLCTTPEAMAKLDSTVKSKLAPITSQVIKECLVNEKPFPWNNFGLMTVSGAKGSIVNFSQICCLLGQQELEGLRVPRMASGKTLPSFVPFDLSPRAGGFIAQRFLTGIRPQEYVAVF